MQLADLDLNIVYTYADYFEWKFDERVELIKGKVFVINTESNRIHQKVAGIIYARLFHFLENKSCEVYSAPFDVRLPVKSKKDNEIITVLQPDVCVICDPKKLDDKGCLGAPDIVVEVIRNDNKI